MANYGDSSTYSTASGKDGLQYLSLIHILGQYYPVESKIHRLDPRMKIIAVILYLISLFLFQNFAGYAVVTVFLGVVIVYSHVPLGYITKGLKPILFLLLFTACFHVFFTQAGDVLFQWKFISITSGGIKRGAFMALRLTYLVIGSSLLTYTCLLYTSSACIPL